MHPLEVPQLCKLIEASFESSERMHLRKKLVLEEVKDCYRCISHSSRTEEGYSFLHRGDKITLLHRLVWELVNKQSIPEGMVVRHFCDNPWCCNPAHLLLGTYQDNSDDTVERDRQSKGELHYNAKLLSYEVRRIKRGFHKQKFYVKRFEISATQVSDIQNGKSWKHI